MVVRANGVVHGNRIDLDERPAELAEGASVAVVITPRPAADDDRHRLIDELCGAWADDDSVEAIFAEIIAGRRSAPARPIPFHDAP